MLFSYVRSKALGDLNTFTAYLGDFPTAPLRPNHYTNTRGDIPHRFIAWGIVNLPWSTRLAPIFEYRSGQPYAIIEARRHYVGIPYNDKTRFRNYITLDERMSKDIKLLAKYTARLSVSVLNLFFPLQPSRRSCEYGRSSVGSFLRPFQTALPRAFRNPVLGSSAISSTLLTLPTSWATGSIAINTNSVSWGSAAKPASRVRSHPGWASGPST